MKKIFTLVAMAAMAIGVNAQDIWNAADEDWSQTSTFVVETTNSSAGLKKVTAVYPTEPTEAQVKADVDASLTLKDYIFTKTVGSVTIKGVSTPNSDNTKAEAWRIQGTNAGQQLNKKDEAGNLIGLVEWSTFVNAKSYDKTFNSSILLLIIFFIFSILFLLSFLFLLKPIMLVLLFILFVCIMLDVIFILFFI